MFGHYLHALERLFGQARTIAESCSNHHPENVIPQIMLRLQAKQERNATLLSVRYGDTQVSHVAKNLPQLPGTTMKVSYIKKREDSWRLHLQRIGRFLTAGEGVWWEHTSTGFHFRDGDADRDSQGDNFKPIIGNILCSLALNLFYYIIGKE